VVNTNTRESSQGDGPEIIILDPNDPEGAYEKLMGRKYQGQAESDEHQGQAESDEHAAAEDVESTVLGAEDNHLIYQLVSELPKGKRDLIALRFAAELTIPEIARVTGRTPEATRKQISHTLERLEAGFHERD